MAAGLHGSARATPRILPNIGRVCREKVETLAEAVRGDGAAEVLEAARALVDRVVVSPPDGPGGPPGIELVGHLAAMLGLAGTTFGTGTGDATG